MRRSRYREEQIIGILAPGGVCQPQSSAALYGVSGATFYEVAVQVRRHGGIRRFRKLKGLEDENRRLKKLNGGIDAGCGDAARATLQKTSNAQIAEEGRGLGDDGD